MTIRAVRLYNFRGFREAEIGLKPLTVLLGPNSAGKSSFGQAVAALSHAQKKYSKTRNASLTPLNPTDAANWPVDFGFHKDLVTSGVQDRVSIGLETTAGWIDLGFGLVPGEPELKLSYIAHPGRFDANSATEQPVSSQGSSIADYSAVRPAPPPISGAVTGIGKIVGVAVQDTRVRLSRKNEQNWCDKDNNFPYVELDGLLLTTVRYGKDGPEFQVEPAARLDLRLFLSGVTYFRAVRKRPERCELPGIEEAQRIGYAGDHTAQILLEVAKKNERIECLFPNAIPNSVDEARDLIDEPWLKEELEILPAVGKWLRHLGLASNVASIESPSQTGYIETKVALDASLEHRNITEVGFGISQVLPIIVAGLLQSANGTLVVELPEAHLHPRAQADLADFFCSLVLAGQSAIVETHSEMFFHRLRLRAAMNANLMERIAVYFCDSPGRDGRCIPPRPVGLTLDAELKWPSGFLQEAWEMETQISAVREARKKSNQ